MSVILSMQVYRLQKEDTSCAGFLVNTRGVSTEREWESQQYCANKEALLNHIVGLYKIQSEDE